jgi:hypothetical protein
MKTLISIIVLFESLFGCLNSTLALNWVASTNAPFKSWAAVSSSADGTKLVAAVNGGGIYTSTNSGLTWTSNSVPARNWVSVASSADGTKLVAAINVISSSGLGGIYSSTNGGSTWTLTGAPSNLQSWASVSCSADGTKLVGCGAYAPTFSHQVYTSADSGNTWNPANVPNLRWYSVASSADGAKLVALANLTNVVYTSTNSGANWTPNPIANGLWYSVASSADGSKLVASSEDGLVYTSTNAGAMWISNNVPAGTAWYCVASSADGNNLALSCYPTIYTSVNGGQIWVSNNMPVDSLVCVASSSDGNRLVAGSFVYTGYGKGQIYVAQPSPPLVSLANMGTNLIVSWPSSASGFHLQQNANLTIGTWADLTNSPIVTNSLNQVTVAKTNGSTFYRLKNP